MNRAKLWDFGEPHPRAEIWSPSLNEDADFRNCQREEVASGLDVKLGFLL